MIRLRRGALLTDDIMRHRIGLSQRKQSLLRLIEVSLWVAGVILVGYYLTVRGSGSIASAHDIRAFDDARGSGSDEERRSTASQSSLLGSVPAPDQSTWSASRIRAREESLQESGLPDAVLLIARIGLEVPVYRGATERHLNVGVARIEGTAAPGEPGNLGIAGHRDGYFRALKNVRPGDPIIVRTLERDHRYRVHRIVVVEPTEIEVLDPTDAATITLITCYPFYFVGHAPQRYIIQGVLEELEVVLASDAAGR